MSNTKTENTNTPAEVIEKKVVENEDKNLTPSQLIEKYTIKDSEGRPTFVDAKKVYDALCIEGEEADKFLGGKDADEYFKGGKIHKSIVKALGDVLDEDRAEVQTLRRIAPEFPDLLMFKDRMQNLYHILIPKKLSEFSLDANGDFVDENIKYSAVVINFNAAVSTKEFGRFPSAFEPMFFQRWLARTLTTLRKKAQSNLIK